MRESTALPISVRFAEHWLSDNSKFIRDEVASRERCYLSLRERLRPYLQDKGLIQRTKSADPVELAAVDAAVVDVALDDMWLVLVQAARHKSGHTVFDEPQRHGPVEHGVRRYLRTPARAVREMMLLAESIGPVIADNSLWSMLMEFNLAITSYHDDGLYRIKSLANVIDGLGEGGGFMRMISNESIVAIPKLGIARSLSNDPKYESYFSTPISDRDAFTILLDEDEFLVPQALSKLGQFGVEARSGMSPSDRSKVIAIYKDELFYTYYRPWGFKKAYRIEGRAGMLSDEIMASIKSATSTREIAEPLPQFYVDHAVKQLHAISLLYGEANRFRIPFVGFNRTYKR